MASGSKVAISNCSTYIQGAIDWETSVSGSNIIVTVRFYMRRTNNYSSDTYSSDVTKYIQISSDPNLWNYSTGGDLRVYGGQQDVWQGPYFTATRTFDASRSGDTIYVGWKTVENYVTGYLGGSGNTTIVLPIAETSKLYGSANGQTKKIQKLYGSVSTTVIEYIVTRIANNPNLNLATFNSAFRQQYPSLVTKVPSYLTFSGTTSNGNITMRFSDNSTQQLARWTSLTVYNQVCSFWGFRSQDGIYSGSVTSSSQTVVKHFSKEITKLYGSVNGQTKLIYSK